MYIHDLAAAIMPSAVQMKQLNSCVADRQLEFGFARIHVLALRVPSCQCDIWEAQDLYTWGQTFERG